MRKLYSNQKRKSASGQSVASKLTGSKSQQSAMLKATKTQFKRRASQRFVDDGSNKGSNRGSNRMSATMPTNTNLTL